MLLLLPWPRSPKVYLTFSMKKGQRQNIGTVKRISLNYKVKYVWKLRFQLFFPRTLNRLNKSATFKESHCWVVPIHLPIKTL